jgi:ornithine cyclodeaminase
VAARLRTDAIGIDGLFERPYRSAIRDNGHVRAGRPETMEMRNAPDGSKPANPPEADNAAAWSICATDFGASSGSASPRYAGGDTAMRIVDLEEIRAILPQVDLVGIIEEGFVRYSRGEVVVPPVGELLFDDPPGDVHIKYGYIRGDDSYVIKIASGFYENPRLGLPASDGMMLVFRQKTGELESVLLDKGYLTNVRTAAAGAVVAKVLAPRNVRRIGVVGAGLQARMQLEMLRHVTDCRNVTAWGVSQDEVDRYAADMGAKGYSIRTTLDADEVGATCNLIVTATPSKRPLLRADSIRPGTHITAMGSDTPEKQELDAAIIAKADIVVADSLGQCTTRGEVYKALECGAIERRVVRELGNVLTDKALQRQNDGQITVADLTGVAVQDIQIAKAVCRALR